MTDPPLSYYRSVKDDPCLACGDYGTHDNPIEAAHFRAVWSRKTGKILPRSHKGLAGWACIPLCKTCHELQHHENERVWLSENVGQYVAQGYVIRKLLEELLP